MTTGSKQLTVDELVDLCRDDTKVSSARSFRAATGYESMFRAAANQMAQRRARILRDMHATGMSYAAIGTEVGLTAPRVHYLVQRANVQGQTTRKE